MKSKAFHCELYSADIFVILDCDGAKCKETLNKRFVTKTTDEDVNGEGFVNLLEDKLGNGVFVLWVRNSKDFGVLLHEIIHLGLSVLNERGVVLDNDAEALTYYCQYLYNKVIKNAIEKR